MLELILTSLIAGCIISLFALAFSFTYKFEGYINFSHIAVFLISGYLSWLFYAYLGINSLLSLFLVVPVSCAVGILFYLPTTLVKNNNSRLLFSIAALAFVQGALSLAFEKELQLPKPTEGLLIGNMLLNSTVILAVLTLIFTAALLFVVKKTRFGKAARAVLADEPTARIIGINPYFIRVVIAAAASAAAGISGLLLTLGAGSTSLSLLPGFKAMVIAAVAGFNLMLILPISFLLLFIENLARVYLPMPQYYSQFIIFGVLFLVMLFAIRSRDT